MCNTVQACHKARICKNLLRSPRMDSQPGWPVQQTYLSYRPARLHRLGSLNVHKYRAQATKNLVVHYRAAQFHNAYGFLGFYNFFTLRRVYSSCTPDNQNFMVRCRHNRGLDKPRDVGQTEAKGSPSIQTQQTLGLS